MSACLLAHSELLEKVLPRIFYKIKNFKFQVVFTHRIAKNDSVFLSHSLALNYHLKWLVTWL